MWTFFFGFAKSGLILSFLVFVTYFSPNEVSAQKNNENFEVVLNRINDGGPSKIRSRHIFVHWSDPDFEIERVIRGAIGLSQEFPDPLILRISIFSSREDLLRLRAFEDFPLFIEFGDSPTEREASVEFEERVGPRQKGFFRAEYYRTAFFELIDHTPDKESPRTERINLKDRK